MSEKALKNIKSRFFASIMILVMMLVFTNAKNVMAADLVKDEVVSDTENKADEASSDGEVDKDTANDKKTTDSEENAPKELTNIFSFYGYAFGRAVEENTDEQVVISGKVTEVENNGEEDESSSIKLKLFNRYIVTCKGSELPEAEEGDRLTITGVLTVNDGNYELNTDSPSEQNKETKDVKEATPTVTLAPTATPTLAPTPTPKPTPTSAPSLWNWKFDPWKLFGKDWF